MAGSTEARHCTGPDWAAPGPQTKSLGLRLGLVSSLLLAATEPFYREALSRSRPSPPPASSFRPPFASAASTPAAGASILALRGGVAFPRSQPVSSLAL